MSYLPKNVIYAKLGRPRGDRRTPTIFHLFSSIYQDPPPPPHTHTHTHTHTQTTRFAPLLILVRQIIMPQL